MNQEIIQIEQEQGAIGIKVNDLTIINQSSYEEAASIKITLSSFRKKIKLFFDPMVSKAKESYDEIKSTRDKHLKPTMALEDTLKAKIKEYERKKELEAEEARRKAEEERQQKINDENKKRQDEAEIFGEDKVEEVKSEEIETEQPLPTIDKVKGLGIRKTYHAKVIDMNKLPIQYHLPDMIALNKLARDTKATAKVDGVEFYED